MRSWRALVFKATLLPAVIIGAGVAFVATPAARTMASVGTVSFSTTPALLPGFDPAISDYVLRCTAGTPVQVSVSNSDGADTTTTVSVDGQAPQNGAFVADVSLGYGQEFSVVATQGAATQAYYVRCLPADFPTWSSVKPGTPQAEYYVVAPSLGNGSATRYTTIYDTNGVPMWWFASPAGRRPLDAKLTANGDLLWTEIDGSFVTYAAQERQLDGSVVDDAIEPVGFPPNFHEVLRLANGNYIVMGDYDRCCYDLSAYGGPTSATLLDNVIQEVTPGGTVVWTWDTADHIGADEVGAQWWTMLVAFGSPYDTFHMNSVETDAAGDLLVSYRHLNAVYKITNPQAATNAGKIIWKLGGTPPAMEPGTRLTISGDPIFAGGGGFGGQHYARYYDAGDGQVYVTLHDNGTNLGRPPRGVRYRIDAGAGTATMIEDVRDTVDPGFRSQCCGSAGKLPGGHWVMSWGFSSGIMELTTAGSRVFVLTLNEPSYRTDAVLPGVLTRAELRAGMDAQYAQTIADTDGDGCPDVDEATLVPPTDPQNPWDFYSVPVPALFAAPDPTIVVRDATVSAADAQSVFAYFKKGAKTGTLEYEQDLDNNGVKDGVQYDRRVVGPGQSGPPDGIISAQDAQLVFAQFKLGYHC